MVAVTLETAVGRIRVCGFRAVWQGAMRRMAVHCNEEQRGLATRKPCNRVRSVLTRMVRAIEGGKLNAHTLFRGLMSGQLRFLG